MILLCFRLNELNDENACKCEDFRIKMSLIEGFFSFYYENKCVSLMQSHGSCHAQCSLWKDIEMTNKVVQIKTNDISMRDVCTKTQHYALNN